MSSKAVLIEEPIEGAIGVTVNVGDEVVVVTTGWSNVSIEKGVYKGYIEGTGWYKKRAKVLVTYRRMMWHNPDGTPFNWNKQYDSSTFESVKQTLVMKEAKLSRMTTLNLNRMVPIKHA
jgi:hypothetical protein